MLDPSIITNGTLAAQAQQEANMKAMGDLGGAFGKLLLARQINDMNQMATPEEEKAFAQKHKLFAPQLMQQYDDNRAAEAKAMRDGLKFYSDLGKTNAETGKLKSESGKIDAEKGKISAETKGMDIDQNAKLNSMVWGSVLEGGKNAGLARLEMQKSRGEIDEATYNQQVGFINNLPGDLKLAREYAMAIYRGAQDPKYILPTADNVLNNETSTNNNVREVEGRKATAIINGEYGVKQAATTGEYGLKRETISQTHQDGRSQASLAWQKQQEDIKAKRGRYESWGGKVYFVNDTGVYEAKDQNGNPMLDNTGAGKNSPQQDVKRAQNVLSLTQQAEQILSSSKATGSGIGSLLDTGASWFGVSTEGAQGTAQLSTIAGQLVSNMPRMEGPQSDKDVQMYKQMAGDLSNASLPVATRMAALKQLQALNEKYLGNNQQNLAPPAGIAAPSTQQSLAARDKYFTGK